MDRNLWTQCALRFFILWSISDGIRFKDGHRRGTVEGAMRIIFNRGYNRESFRHFGRHPEYGFFLLTILSNPKNPKKSSKVPRMISFWLFKILVKDVLSRLRTVRDVSKPTKSLDFKISWVILSSDTRFYLYVLGTCVYEHAYWVSKSSKLFKRGLKGI